jgi:hypothetical protein
VPVVRLTEIFRQAAQSRIVTSVHRINQGVMPDLSQPEATSISCSRSIQKAPLASATDKLKRIDVI